jgi:hypothetical protein
VDIVGGVGDCADAATDVERVTKAPRRVDLFMVGISSQNAAGEDLIWITKGGWGHPGLTTPELLRNTLIAAFKIFTKMYIILPARDF